MRYFIKVTVGGRTYEFSLVESFRTTDDGKLRISMARPLPPNGIRAVQEIEGHSFDSLLDNSVFTIPFAGLDIGRER